MSQVNHHCLPGHDRRVLPRAVGCGSSVRGRLHLSRSGLRHHRQHFATGWVRELNPFISGRVLELAVDKVLGRVLRWYVDNKEGSSEETNSENVSCQKKNGSFLEEKIYSVEVKKKN